MKPELLEPLLLDRALGELSPEVAALLETHLAQNPAAAARAAEFAGTLSLARIATATPVTSPHRPLDVERLRRAHRAQRTATRRSEILRLAACLALGLGAGWLAHAPQPHAQVVASASHPAPAPSSPPAATSSTRFWSLSRILAEERARSASEPRNDNRYELHWNSPTQLPRVEGKP